MSAKKNTFFLVLLIFVAAATRLVPHPPNVTPLGAMSLFGAAYFGRKYLAILVPVLALWLSNIVLDNTIYAQYYDGFVWFNPSSLWVIGAMVAIALLGFAIFKKVTATRVVAGALIASAIFYLVTNFGAWLGNPMYSQDFNGLIQSYVAGLPFLRNSLLGNLFYSGVLFGIYYWITRRSIQSRRA